MSTMSPRDMLRAPRDARLAFRMPTELRDRLDQLADLSDDKTLSDYLVRVLAEHVAANPLPRKRTARKTV